MKTRTLIRLDAVVGLPLCALAFLLGLPGRLWEAHRPARPRPVRRILVTKFLGMGSVLLATPLVRRLRSAYPGARITFLSFDANADLLARLDGIDEVITVPRGGLARLLCGTPALLARLRRARFDLALDLEFYSRLSNLVTWGSGARRRVGFFVRARWRGSLLTDPVYFNPTLPYGDAVLALLRPLDVVPGLDRRLVAPRLDEHEEQAALGRLLTRGVPAEGTVIIVNVNASDLCVERRWPAERFARLVERFGAEIAHVDRLVFIGAPGEVGVVRGVLDAIRADVLPSCVDLSGRTTLVELVALMRRAALLVTNDSGPLHLAASVGLPTVSFFGPETPALYGPVGDNHLVFYARHWCSPCLSVYNAKIAMCDGDNQCMRRIELDTVVSSTATFSRERVGLAPPHPRQAAPERHP